MSSMTKWLVPYMAMSAWLSFVLIVIGLIIHSPNGLIEVASANKRTKEIASYVTASVSVYLYISYINSASWTSFRVMCGG